MSILGLENNSQILNWKLRESIEEDYPFIYGLIEDFFNNTNLNVTYIKLESYEDFVKRNFSKKSINYTIINERDEKIGYIHMNQNEIGYFLAPEYRGKGIGSQAVKKMMELNPRKTYFATINNNNIQSINLVKKLGFKPKGTIFEKNEF